MSISTSSIKSTLSSAFIVEMSAEIELPGHSNVKTRPVSSQNKDYIKNALKKFRKGEKGNNRTNLNS